jgi:hypothetical protein
MPATQRQNLSQKRRKRNAPRPVLWALRRRSGLYEPKVFGTRRAASVHAAEAMDGLVVVPLYAARPY